MATGPLSRKGRPVAEFGYWVTKGWLIANICINEYQLTYRLTKNWNNFASQIEQDLPGARKPHRYSRCTPETSKYYAIGLVSRGC